MLITISGPSGAGKSTIVKSFCTEYNMKILPSWTTRKKRIGDIENSYHYVTMQKYYAMSKDNQFIYEDRIGNIYYGTTHLDIKKAVKSKKIWIADFTSKSVIDLIKSGTVPKLIFFVFIPLEMLQKRLEMRGDDVIAINARKEHYYNELQNGIFVATLTNNILYFDGCKPINETIYLMIAKLKHIGVLL